MSALVLDSGALVALDRRNRDIARRLRVLWDNGLPVTIPAGCLAQVWRDGSRQVALLQALKQSTAHIEPIDGSDARRIGELLATSGTSDVVDAHVALVAVRCEGTVVTSDPADIRRLAPEIRLLTV